MYVVSDKHREIARATADHFLGRSNSFFILSPADVGHAVAAMCDAYKDNIAELGLARMEIIELQNTLKALTNGIATPKLNPSVEPPAGRLYLAHCLVGRGLAHSTPATWDSTTKLWTVAGIAGQLTPQEVGRRYTYGYPLCRDPQHLPKGDGS